MSGCCGGSLEWPEPIQVLLEYKDINAGISAGAVKALKRHLWYLTEEMIPLSLFSEIVPAQERQALAHRLLELKPDQAVITPCNQHSTDFGKPRFPENVSQNTTLADVAGKNSWFTMNILQIDDQFLTDNNVDAWLQSQAYQSSLRNILAINVVNDSAERGVKLSPDFLPAVHSEKHYQNVLQVVEQDRKRLPILESVNWKKLTALLFRMAAVSTHI